ncbi:vacuolar protein sorting-associated protein 13B-like [Patiria miniata]|uniref:Chorein N-terminal domain-containing protein n=1 Tax=Patiria miniata TaxID=46514 RepID=A0A913ZJF9_PATMI|nr:vacuolar protein sorting-associated protein 13B-like [Patiria miniata]XP_038051924.1 vacuolar protein sorting-associated protein 13B-like [Patiria miniata]
MLESYISPFLLGYVDKYIKNLKPEDLQLSLWGGDLVLNKLDLRLDVLEQELNLPLTFVSGHIHELRIHVPWTRLGYEPVVITINTIECALKLRDEGYDEHDSASSKSSLVSKTKTDVAIKAKQKYEKQDRDLPPGYVQSLMNRVINNVTLVIKNLILKYVEDDIVLSVNVKSAESFAVNADWQSAFTELSLPELVLRRVCEFSDLTVCLDKRNASGKIEIYQEPMVYRCAVSLRMQMTYASLNAKRPSVVKMNVYCEELDMSLSDTQLPMFLRLLQLLVALYYGTLDQGNKLGESGDQTAAIEAIKADTKPDPTRPEGSSSEGWASWAWSYVPELLYYEEDEDQMGGSKRREKRPDPILSVGLYCNRARITFKLTKEISTNHPVYSTPSSKLETYPLLRMELSGSAIEILMQGEEFFVHQMGFSYITASVMGDCVCGLVTNDDEQAPGEFNPSSCFLTCGTPDYNQKRTKYLTNSLFDENCPENRQQRAPFILDWDTHQDTYSEALATQRFGAVWTDYLFVAEMMGNKNASDSSSRSSHHSADDSDPIFDMKETSSKRFLFNPAKLVVGSDVVHRLMKFVECAADHEYEPYSIPQPEIVDENRPSATPEQVTTLEDWVPSRSTHLTLLNLQILFPSAQHPYYSSSKSPSTTKQGMSFQETPSVPTLCLQTDRIDFQSTEPMYARRLIQPVSKLPINSRSSKLMYHCYSHKYYKIFGCQFGLTFIDPSSDLSPPILPIMPSWSAALYHKELVLPMYWKDKSLIHSELMLELPSISCNATKAQCLLMLHICNSWTSRQPEVEAARLAGTSLLEDVFKPSVKAFPSGQPVLQASLNSLEVKFTQTRLTQAMSGTLSQAQITVQALDQGRASDTPLFHGPVDTSDLHHHKSFMKQQSSQSQLDAVDLITFTIQIPRSSDSDNTSEVSCGVFLLDLQGTAVCVDPIIYTWLLYQPRGQVRSKVTEEASSRKNQRSVRKQHSSEGSSSVQRVKPTSPDKIKSSQPIQRQSSTVSQQTPNPLAQQPRSLDTAEESKMADKDKQTDREKLLEKLWLVVKQLTVQVDMQTCFIALPTDHLTFGPDVTSIPQCIQQGMLGNSPPETVVLSLPVVKVTSLNHQMILALQEIPLDRKDLPPDTGEKLPWSVKASNFSMYTIHSDEGPYYLLKPLVLSATVGVTSSHSGRAAKARPGLGLCVHADMQEIQMACSKSQVTLACTLLNQALSNKSKLIEVFNSSYGISTQTASVPIIPASPSKSAPRVLSSVASSGQPDNQETTTLSLSSPAEVPVSPQGLAPPDQEDSSDTVKLSLWLQLTLQKFCFSLYGGAPPMKISCEVEDLTTSFDFQDVYSKVTCKVGSLNVNHYTQNNGSWQCGPFCGVLFSCTDIITHNTSIRGLRLRPHSHSAPRPFNPFAAPHATKPSDAKSHGFLSATWTMAQGRSLVQKLSGKVKESKKSSSQEITLSRQRFIHEIVVAVQPFDVMLWCPLYVSMLDIFSTVNILDVAQSTADISGIGPKQRPAMPQFQREISTTSIRSPSDSQQKRTASLKSASTPNQEWLSSRNLPLIYIDCKEVRIFAPTKEPRLLGETKGQEDETIAMETQDTFLLQVNSVCLRPHADNPLQRLVLKKEIFRRAVQAGTTQTPGSDVEDRQYQLDVNDLSVSVALWDQIQACCDQGKGKGESEIDGMPHSQNPALEWNTDAIQSPTPREVSLLPLVVGIDIRFVASPAIIIDKAHGASDKHRSSPVTVCGHSIEVDFTSDMTFYLSTGQVCLLQTLVQDNFLSLMKIGNLMENQPSQRLESTHQMMSSVQTGKLPKTREMNSDARHKGKKSSPPVDSGLGSEDSTQAGVKGQKLKVAMQEIPVPISVQKIPSSSSAQAQKAKKVSKSSNFTPIDALITAGKVSVFLYSCINSAEENLAQVHDQERNESLPTIEEGRTELQPFLFVTVMQPSAVLSLEHQQQRAELTIYDLTVEGASLKNATRELSGDEPLPNPADFTVPWFETCPGEPHPKTGVRPALVTFTVNDCLSNQASAKVKIARPAKVSFSLAKVDEAVEFIRRLTPPKSIQISAQPVAEKDALSQGGAVLIPVLPHYPPVVGHGNRRPSSQSHHSSTHSDALDVLSRVKSVSMEMTEFVVVMATIPDSEYPHVVCSFGDCQGAINLQNNNGIVSEIQAKLRLDQLLLKTSIRNKTRPLIGPFNLSMDAKSHWTAHGGSAADRSMNRVTAGVSLGHVTVFLGQEHLNCVALMQRHVTEYLNQCGQEQDKTFVKAKESSPSQHAPVFLLKDVISQQPDRHYKDDLRAGAFRYISDGDGVGLSPKPNEIVFASLALQDSTKGHWGSMTWCYPEPRILTHVSVTPIPLHQAGAADSEPTAEEEVPCTLEYWDDLRQDFCVYRQLYVSEMHSYHLSLPASSDKTSRQAVASLWRVVLNSVAKDSDDEPLSPQNHPGLIISPTALAASMRVDSSFSAHLLPVVSLGFKMECMEVRLAHHTDTLGKAQPKWLEPFVSDNLSPADQEFMVIRLDTSDLYLNHWSSAQANTQLQMSTTVQCDILTYRNLTMATLLHPMRASATVDTTWGQNVEGHVDLGSVKVSVGQEAVHSLNMAAQAISQVNSAGKEHLLFSNYAICNDTDETLRFGQVHTDESIVLQSRKGHEYSWRTHKHHRQRLHVCIEGWRNWRWSEPFSLDEERTIVRTLQHKDQTATLFIKIKKISALQKQVIFCGQHFFTNALSLDLEIQLIRLARIGSQVIDAKHFHTLSANSSLPSLTCSSSDITGVRVKLNKEGGDWSEQFAISGEMSREQSVLKVSDQDGVHHYMWCRIFTEEHENHVQRLVLFSPLFVVRCHLPWPMIMNIQSTKPHDLKVVQVKGQGSDQSLYRFAPNAWHNLTFQLGLDSSPSNPPITINTDMIDELSLGLSKDSDDASPVTMETIAKQCQHPNMMEAWPYNHIDYESTKSFNCTLRNTEVPSGTHSLAPNATPDMVTMDTTYKPNTDLQVTTTRLSRNLNTIMVDVLPWCLMVNETDLDIDVMEDGSKTLFLQKGQTIAPQRFKEGFYLQLSKAKYTTSNKSKPIHLVAASVPATTHDPSTLTLISEGYIHITLSVQRMGVAQNRVVRLALRSTVKHNIRVITILPQFMLCNKSKKAVMFRAFDTIATNKVTVQDSTLQSVSVPPAVPEETYIPITQWNIPSDNQPIPSPHPTSSDTQDKSQYLSLALAKSEGTNRKTDVKDPTNQEQTHWSRWILLDISRPRIPVSVPINQIFSQASPKTTSTTETIATQPFVNLLAEQEGVMYVTIDDDPVARVTIANACSYPLHFGQTPFHETEQLEVLEQHSPVPSIPIILPHCLVHYDLHRPLPSADGGQRSYTPSLHLCLGSFLGLAISLEEPRGQQRQHREEKQSKYSWSEAIQLATDNRERSEIVSVAGIGYVLVSSHCVGTQLQIRVDPLSMDVSKSGGRSGMQSSTEPSIRAESNTLLAFEMEHSYPEKTESSSETAMSSSSLSQLQYKFRLSAGSVVVMVMDEITDLVQSSEMLRVSIQDVLLLSYPIIESGTKSPVQQQQVQLSARACQVDNQMFKGAGKYDFAVVLCSQEESIKSGEDEVSRDGPVEELANFCHQHHTLVAQVMLESCTDLFLGLASLEVEVKPLELYLEDHFLYDLLLQVQTFIPAKSHEQNRPITSHRFPAKVRVTSCALKEPISMRQFLIQPIRLFASVHASLKLFVAVDSTPLSFRQFDSGPMFATTRQLVQALTVHYTSGALFKAGWVLGSLEILGNPAGLLRNVRSGLTDSVMLPYEGLTRGPAAFVAGVTSGTSSLLRHLSAGTLTSVTKFAASISRNLDRLTLDEDHIARREKQRRKVPDRVTDGLMQGLSGFGISLLGAIGGIADQPIKSFHQAPEVSSPTQKATGVIRGVGKGLVGVVIKPLGGAAEFVSQTGQGILHSAGLVETRSPKGECVTSLTAMATNSRLKYTWKMLHSLPNADILMDCDVTTVTFHGLQRGGCLLLTPEILFVVSSSEDTQQQAFPIFQVECVPLAGSSEGVGVKMKRPSSPTVSKKAETCSRVADFVGTIPSRPCDPLDIDPLVSSDSQSEGSSLPGGHTVEDSTGTTVYQYFLQRACYRDTFLSLFEQAKNRLLGKGFCYDETNNTGFSRFKMWHTSTKMQLEGLE